MGDENYTLVFSGRFEHTLRRLRKKNPDLARALVSHFPKLEREPALGKPLRHSLRIFRRLQIEGSFVLLYEVRDFDVHLIDFDHHDRIYKKYS
ncbi:MAG: type II toxin-antitoxin system RelE/ParE family toxin [Patescibacteria group bacterium]